jgi:HPt (histidine-containing phosphotransfer) domain-containing protein
MLEFVDDYQDIGASVGAALCQGDKTAASHLAHTIKGVAGNLSALRVQQAAMALEQSLRESPEADEGPHLTALVEAMGQIAAPLTNVPRAQPGEDRSHGSKGPKGEAIPVMRRLAALLAEDNMEAEDCLEELRACLDHDCFPDAWRRLEKGIANLDFDSAKEPLREIASQLDPEGSDYG